MRPSRYVADFDSTTGMVNALGAYLHGRDWPLVGVMPPALLPVLRPAARLIDAAPVSVRERLWAWSGWLEALSPQRTGEVDSEDVSHWLLQRYPRDRQYPALMIGSANGALIHLAAALGVPWLPQNFLVPVRHGGRAHPDDPWSAMEWAREPARRLLDANPDLALHQMHDPNQDRPMLHHMAFFRLKRMRLGREYGRFIEETLTRGGTIFIVDCARRWPGTTVQDRHVFQFGGMGAVTPEEYVEGSQRVADFLERYGADVRRWQPPAADDEYPEGEWGFEETIVGDIEELATRRGYRVRRIRFEEPEDISPLVANLHRWWYGRLGRPVDRLLVESFLLLEPYWTLRTGSVPFWMKFTTDVSARRLREYLDASPAYRHIDLLLFEHGVRSAGLVPVEEWRALLRRARRTARFVALRPERYPSSVSTYVRYLDSLRRVGDRLPLPQPLTLRLLDEYLAGAARNYPVEWIDGSRGGREAGAGERHAAQAAA